MLFQDKSDHRDWKKTLDIIENIRIYRVNSVECKQFSELTSNVEALILYFLILIYIYNSSYNSLISFIRWLYRVNIKTAIYVNKSIISQSPISEIETVSFISKWTFLRIFVYDRDLVMSFLITRTTRASWNIKNSYWSCSSKMEPDPCIIFDI